MLMCSLVKTDLEVHSIFNFFLQLQLPQKYVNLFFKKKNLILWFEF